MDVPRAVLGRRGKEVLRRVYREIVADRLTLVSAGSAFFAMLSIFPAIAALVAIYGLLADRAEIAREVEGLAPILPAGVLDIVAEQLTRVSANDENTLGLTFVIGLGVSLWSANAGMKAVFGALNLIRGEAETRGFFHLNALSFLFTLGAILFTIAALLAVVALPVALRIVGLESATTALLAVMRWPTVFIVVALWIALIYRYGPSRTRPAGRWITPGSVSATILWVVVSMLFSWYAANIASFNETYGSLGAVIGFMMWLWLTNMVVLIGAAVDVEIEHPGDRRAR